MMLLQSRDDTNTCFAAAFLIIPKEHELREFLDFGDGGL